MEVHEFEVIQVMPLVPDNDKDTAAAGNFKERIGIFSYYKLELFIMHYFINELVTIVL